MRGPLSWPICCCPPFLVFTAPAPVSVTFNPSSASHSNTCTYVLLILAAALGCLILSLSSPQSMSQPANPDSTYKSLEHSSCSQAGWSSETLTQACRSWCIFLFGTFCLSLDGVLSRRTSADIFFWSYPKRATVRRTSSCGFFNHAKCSQPQHCVAETWLSPFVWPVLAAPHAV